MSKKIHPEVYEKWGKPKSDDIILKTGDYLSGSRDALKKVLDIINERRSEIPTYFTCSAEEWARFSGQACILEILRDDIVEMMEDTTS